MRLVAAAGVVALLLALPPPASADDLGGRQTLQCADGILSGLMELPAAQASAPTLHVGLVTLLMRCTYYLPPAATIILDAMHADIDTIYRFREDGADGGSEDVSTTHRWLVCNALAAIYSSTYYGLIPEYGSDAVAGLPEPQTHITACERWVEGR